ncbi:MAG: biotin--[acetyl-CoA-carboxylase] ligase [Bacteroidota bacterium]
MPFKAPVINLEQVTSTNEFAQELLRDHQVVNGTCISATFQTAGKGQRGNTWYSKRDENITLSIIFLPDRFLVSRHFMLNVAFSLGLRDYLLTAGVKNILVKWPNDIVAGGKKLSGILIENAIRGELICSIVAGFGINVNQVVFDESLLKPATSICLETGNKLDIKQELEKVLSFIYNRYDQLQSGNDELLMGEYKNVLYRIHQSATYKTDSEIWTGVIRNVTREGLLEIQRDDGKELQFGFKQIEFM